MPHAEITDKRGTADGTKSAGTQNIVDLVAKTDAAYKGNADSPAPGSPAPKSTTTTDN